jgi:MFS family permease
MWIGPAASTVNDLVMPRMRAIASAFYILMVTFIGLALGPYVIGFISDELVQSGTKSPDALRQAMMIGLYMLAFAGSMMLIASRFLEKDENSRIDRAIALGENV